MPRAPVREMILDAGCLVAGRVGRAAGRRLVRPTFIVGTGRCGTTLLVRMLESHPDLTGFPGEANELWHPALEPFERTALPTPPIEVDPAAFTAVSLAHWPPHHAQRIRDVFTGWQLIRGMSRAFFSKSAMISFMIPQILEEFPDARIIHIYRFGPSVVESYVKKNFGKYSRFSFAKPEYRKICARYWNDCILEIDARTRALPADRLLDFSYETLCEDPRGTLDRVAAFLGVRPNGFGFDTADVADQNYKARAVAADAESAELLRLMAEGLALKGYTPAGSAP